MKPFLKELIELMKKHNVSISVDCEVDYVGLQNLTLEFDDEESCGNYIYGSGRIEYLTGDDILSVHKKFKEQK